MPPLATACFQGVVESTKVCPHPFFVQDEHLQLCHLVLIRFVLQTLHPVSIPLLSTETRHAGHQEREAKSREEQNEELRCSVRHCRHRS